MLKKIFVSAVVFCLLIVQASAATNNGLKAAFDELNYTLNVEWDQKDRAVYNAAQTKFAKTLKELQAQGLTNKQLVDFVVSQTKDQKLAADLEKAFNMVILTKMNQEEAHKLITDVMSKSYSQGANWNGGGAIVGLLVVVALVAVVLIVAGEARVEDGCYQVYKCDEYCSLGACYEDCYYECI